MSSSSYPIDIRALGKSYGTVEVLKGIDLRIEPGEFLVLVGPSGCGKSTLLRCIAGLEEISGGVLEIGGRKANDVAPKDRDLAMVFQSYALYPHMTVGENMGFSLQIRKMPSSEIAARVDEAARRLDLSHLLERFPKELSGGQRQRVAVGRAIVRQPTAFLFDEPLSNLDAALRTQLRVELRKLHHELKTTMIYVTHDQVEAMTLADRIAVLKDGILQQVGTPSELFHRPSNRFVASFIGSPSMNFFDSVEVAEDGSLRCPGIEAEAGAIALEARGRCMTLGFRPTALSLDSQGPIHIKGTIAVVEVLGWAAHVHIEVEGRDLVAQLPAEKTLEMKPGADLVLALNQEEIHFFDPTSGAALEAG